MKINYIINHRGLNTRLANLKCLLKHVKNFNANIIVVEQDNVSHKEELELPKNCEYIFAKNDGLFNRSWGFNVGFKHFDSDIYVFSDNDVLITKACFDKSIEFIKAYSAINPYSAIVDTSPQESNYIRRTGDIKTSKRIGRDGINFSGGVVVLTQKAFIKIGGWDEEFRGWGGEDDAMAFKFRKFLGKEQMKTVNGVAYHLWHERTENDKRKHSHYDKNIKRLHWYDKKTKEEVIESFNLENIGDVKKYE